MALRFEKIVEAVSAITGWETNLWELMRATERSEVMMRVFNNREGFGPEDDRLIRRFHEPLPEVRQKAIISMKTILEMPFNFTMT